MVKIIVGVVVIVAAWIPINLAEPRDIPFGAAILAILGTVVGGIIAIVGLVQWVRRGSMSR
jgi:hypothetical protein